MKLLLEYLIIFFLKGPLYNKFYNSTLLWRKRIIPTILCFPFHFRLGV
jgi:hypothetical protein